MNKEKIDKIIKIAKHVITYYICGLGVIYTLTGVYITNTTEQVLSYTYLGDPFLHFGVLCGMCGFILLSVRNVMFINISTEGLLGNAVTIITSFVTIAMVIVLGLVEIQMFHDMNPIGKWIAFMEIYYKFMFVVEVGIVIKMCEFFYIIYSISKGGVVNERNRKDDGKH